MSRKKTMLFEGSYLKTKNPNTDKLTNIPEILQAKPIDNIFAHTSEDALQYLERLKN